MKYKPVDKTYLEKQREDMRKKRHQKLQEEIEK